MGTKARDLYWGVASRVGVGVDMNAVTLQACGSMHDRHILAKTTVEILGDVELARRLTQSCHHQHRRHSWPRDIRSPLWHQIGAQSVQAQRPPQSPGKPDIPKTPGSLKPYSVETDRYRPFWSGAFLEKLVLIQPACHPTCQGLRN